MASEAPNLAATIAAIDLANADDPGRVGGDPLALRQGQRASVWLADLDTDPSLELQLAVRAHHLRRWELARKDYPEGRAGYLRWRRENKKHQADSLAAIMRHHGWPEPSVIRTGELLARTALSSDPETQMLEDAACLVFVETQFDEMTERLDHDHMVKVVAKTLRKMSDSAIGLAATVSLSEQSQQVLSKAIASLADEDQS